MDLEISIHRILKAYQVLAIQGDFKGLKLKLEIQTINDTKLPSFKARKTPIFASGSLPNFHHSKKCET